MFVAVGITLVLQMAGAAAYVDYAAAYLAFPGNEDYGEGPILYQLEWLRAIGTMYRPIAEPPHAVSNYPPVFHLATWLMTTVFDDPLTAGRLVSLLSTLASCLLIFAIVYSQLGEKHSRTARAFGGTLAALFFLSHYSVTLWSVMARVDMLALALGLLGILVFFLSIRHRSRGLACLFGLIFVVAAFTKQNMIAAAAATFATTLFVDRRQAYAALAASVPTGLIVIAVLQANSGGEFLLHAFYYNLNEFQWENLGQLTLVVIALNPVEILILIFGSAYLYVTWRRRRDTDSPDRRAGPDIPLILFAGFFAASLLNVVSSFKQGAAPNYYVEFQAAASLLVGMTAVRAIAFLGEHRMDPEYHKYSLAVILSLSVLCWQVVHGWDKKYRHPYAAIAPNMERVIDLVASVDRPVISEDMVLLYKTGKPLFYQPFIMSRLTMEGRWDAAPLLERLRRGEVPMIILTTAIDSQLHRDRFTPAFTDTLKSRYRLLERFGHFEVYVPS
jgi:4-amino-4-deoxy-L-arabinose transferase-like glycosyltransferase